MAGKAHTFDTPTTRRVLRATAEVEREAGWSKRPDYGTRDQRGRGNSPASNPSLFPVNVATDGGGPGDGTTACSFTYTVTALSGDTLGTAMTPAMQRPAVGKTTAAHIGDGYYAGGVFVLHWVDEVPNRVKRVCP